MEYQGPPGGKAGWKSNWEIFYTKEFLVMKQFWHDIPPLATSLKRVSSRFTIHRKKCSWNLGIRVEWVWSFEKWKRRSQKICVSFQRCWSGLDPDRIRTHWSFGIRISLLKLYSNLEKVCTYVAMMSNLYFWKGKNTRIKVQNFIILVYYF